MPKATFNFPAGFLWGSAAAAHCVEGSSPATDWLEWEQQPGRIVDGSTVGRGCEWWSGRWREDFDRAQETDQKALRFSIEWARVQPEHDRWDEPALDRYRDMLIGLKQRGITPILCLHHVTNPLWFAEAGGWENEQSVNDFTVYARRVVEALKAYCALWISFAAPEAYVWAAYRAGTYPPGKRDELAAGRALRNMAKAHAAAREVVRALQSEGQVGFTQAWSGEPPQGKHKRLDLPRDAFAAAFRTGKLELGSLRENLPQLKGALDFLGIDYFSRETQRPSAPKLKEKQAQAKQPSSEALLEGGEIANDPDGLREAIKWGWKFELPLYITANGCNDSRDEFRRRYLVEHVHALWHMVNFNAPVRGYLHWSLVDHFAWEQGWSAKYGLWAVDSQTQQRARRKSADLYAEICRTGSLSSEMVEKHCPEVFDRIFPV